jgi:ankyrin repeat protein
MVEFLLIKSCDPNSVSNDEYTPLQLAITLRASSIFQTLVSHPRIDLNKLTQKGTALHLAV